MGEFFEQLAEETDAQWAAFRTYRDLPVYHRSIRNSTAAELGHTIPWDPSSVTAAQRRKHGTTLRQREKWSSENHWTQRVKLWDEAEARRRYLEREDRIREMQDRHATVGQTLVELGFDAIAAIRAAQDAPPVLDDKGRVIPPRVFMAGSAHAILRAVELGCRIERAAYGVVGDPNEDVPVVEERAAGPRGVFSESPQVAAAHADLLVARRRAEREAKAKAAK